MSEPYSPLKEKPLRQAGQSLDHQLIDLFETKVFDYLLPVAITFVMLVTTVVQTIIKAPSYVWLIVTILYFIGACIYSIPRIIKAKHEAEKLRLGRDGERLVAEALAGHDGNVLHDIQMEGFNLDHVLVSQRGIFLFETKTRTKANSKSKIYFDGHQIDIDGFRTDEPLIQVRAEASALQKLLVGLTGKTFSIKPVLVYPGWYVNYSKLAGKSDVAVCNPHMIEGILKAGKYPLSDEEHRVVVAALSRYVKA